MAEPAEVQQDNAWQPYPMLDYSRPLLGEQEAASVLRRIVDQGGQMLYNKYLERKAFPFAAEAAVEALVSSTQMGFVPCESGEEDMEEWTLEPEPQPRCKDSWARMVLPRKDDLRMRSTFASTKGSGFGGSSRRRTRKQPESREGKQEKKEPVEAPRSWSIAPAPIADPDEERHREVKHQDDTRKREKERKAKEAAKVAQQEKIRIEALHEEMAKRPHTFDLNGDVLWVEQPNVAKLPNVVQTVQHRLKKNLAETETTMNASKSKTDLLSPPKARAKRRKFNRKNEAAGDFPDSFVPLASKQPPILETMQMRNGVHLEHKGKKKEGLPPEAVEGKMSRGEYLRNLQREVSGETMMEFSKSGAVRAVGGNSGNAPSVEASPSSKRHSEVQSPKADDSMTGSASAPLLPAIDKGRPPPEGASSPSQANDVVVLAGSGAAVAPVVKGSAEGKMSSQMAPPFHTRARKFESVGHLGMPPRIRPPSLGKLDVLNPKSSQPPLGATMGHGLLRTENSVEEFFFPPFTEQSPIFSLPRSKSDSSLPKKDRNPLTKLPISSMPPNAMSSIDEASARSQVHGSIVPQQTSPAYRNMKNQLFPGGRAPPSVV